MPFEGKLGSSYLVYTTSDAIFKWIKKSLLNAAFFSIQWLSLVMYKCVSRPQSLLHLGSVNVARLQECGRPFGWESSLMSETDESNYSGRQTALWKQDESGAEGCTELPSADWYHSSRLLKGNRLHGQQVGWTSGGGCGDDNNGDGLLRFILVLVCASMGWRDVWPEGPLVVCFVEE